MKKTALVILGYGLTVLLGGLIGCFIAGSIPSLVAGLLFGSLILWNAYKVYKNNIKGLTLALMQSIFLGSFFIYRLKTTGKFFPAAIMITVSFIVAIILLMAHPIDAAQSKKPSKK